jgi:hypothetical protein
MPAGGLLRRQAYWGRKSSAEFSLFFFLLRHFGLLAALARGLRFEEAYPCRAYFPRQVGVAKYYYLSPGYIDKPSGQNTEIWRTASLSWTEKGLGEEKFGRC